MFASVYIRFFDFLTKSRIRLKLIRYRKMWREKFNLHPSVKFDYSSNFVMLTGKARINIGDQTLFRSYCSVLCGDEGVLNIGSRVFFNNYCSINCLHEISIGDDSIFGEGVRLYDHNHGFRQEGIPFWKQPMKKASINIGTNCWIGSNTIILSNVKIGDNVVIGANNIIYKSIPSNSIVKSGIPQIIEPLTYHT